MVTWRFDVPVVPPGFDLDTKMAMIVSRDSTSHAIVLEAQDILDAFFVWQLIKCDVLLEELFPSRLLTLNQ